MKLSDVMSAMGLSTYAEVGLVLFMGAFVAVAVSLFRSGAGPFERAGRLPLEDADDDVAGSRAGGNQG